MEKQQISAFATSWIQQAHDIISNGSSGKPNQNDLPRLIENDPDNAWLVIKAVLVNLSRANNVSISDDMLNKILGLLGAGDLEDLLQNQHRIVNDYILPDMTYSKLMKRALNATLQGSIPQDLWDRLQTELG